MLLIYMWKIEVLLFGCFEFDVVLQEVKEQIVIIYLEIEEQFDGGVVFVWYDKLFFQGVYIFLKFNQFQNVWWLLYLMYNIFFVGEGFFFVLGWIQGVLEFGF